MSPSAVSLRAPLSLAQERFLFVNRLVDDLPLHHHSVSWRIRGALDPDLLSDALDRLVDRQTALRTRYPVLDDGTGVQEVLSEWRPPLEVVRTRQGSRDDRVLRDWREATSSRPFRLTDEPGFRASLLEMSTEDHVLLLVFHHIAFDGWSYGVVVRDLSEAYTALETGAEPRWPPLPHRYSDYAVAQRDWVKSAEAERQKERWGRILDGVSAELELPTDRERPRRPSYRIERLRHAMAPELRPRLESFAESTGATPFSLLMAAFQALLANWTGSRDFVVGVPMANRQDRADYSALVGCFINILLLRANLSEEPSFLELVRRVRRAAFEAFPYQKLPFDEVVKVVSSSRGLGRIMFNYRDYSFPPLRLGRLECEDLAYDPGMSAVDLSVDVMAHRQGPLELEIEYSLDLFDRTTITQVAREFERLLGDAIGAPERALPLHAKREPDHRPSTDDPDPAPEKRIGRAGGVTEIERILVPIWEETLDRRKIGRRDDFFDLGGESLQAVHMIALAERELGGTIPLGWILEHPTVERLAAAIEKRGLGLVDGTRFMIPIREGGSRPPVFCVHGGAGGVFAFREVANQLGADQPVHGFMLVGTPLDRIPRSVEAMAERYIEEMRKVQPDGPYRVLGYSFGSLVAYEMARQLAEQGESVALLGLIVPPVRLSAVREPRRRTREAKAQARSRRDPTIYSICLDAATRYRPRSYEGRIVVFWSEKEWARRGRFWKRLARGGLDERKMPGGHLSVLLGENAPGTARELRDLLDDAMAS